MDPPHRIVMSLHKECGGFDRSTMDYQMRKLVWIESKDQEYEDRLISFLDYHYGSFLEVHHYKEIKELSNSFCGSSHPVLHESILLSDCADKADTFEGRFVPLTIGESKAGINLLQSGHNIARDILASEYQKETAPGESSVSEPPLFLNRNEFSVKKEGKIISVFSPVGGCGKSTLARAIAQNINENCEGSVLLLTMETASDWPMYFTNGSDHNLSDLLCLLLEKEEERFDNELVRVAVRQPEGLYFVKPCTSHKDLDLLSQKEWHDFFRRLEKRFAFIVLDLDGSLSKLNEILFELSNRVYLIEPQSGAALSKMQSFREEIAVSPTLGRVFREKTKVVFRGKERGRKNGEAFIADEREMFVRKADKLQFNKQSTYYRQVRGLIGKEVGIFG